ncbi:MAG: hypothetical protein L3K09_00685 [Thermoplasmata archaeon]|nr:hypothetical protein [Thermoplasmata archaeon]
MRTSSRRVLEGAPHPVGASLRTGVGLSLVLLLLTIAPNAGATGATTVLHAPFKGSVSRWESVQADPCSKVVNVKPWNFSVRSGSGGGATFAWSHTCPSSPYFNNYTKADGRTGANVSLSVRVPRGPHHIYVDLVLRWGAKLREHNGSSNGTCPEFPTSQTNASYYNGSGWSYWPNLSGPILYTNHTRFYFLHSDGVNSHGCSGSASIDAQLAAGVRAGRGGTTPPVSPSTTDLVEAYVAETNSTHWYCRNTTFWDFGLWANSSRACYSYNVSAPPVAYDLLAGTNRSTPVLLFSGTLRLTLSTKVDGNVSALWILSLRPSVTLLTETDGWLHGSAFASFNLGTFGNGITVRSITVN